jgi:hypothetical protein
MKSKNALSMVLLTTAALFSWGRREEVCNSLEAPPENGWKPKPTAKREVMENALRQIEEFRFDPEASSGFKHDRIEEANASLFDASHLSEPLTNYAVGWRDETGLDEALNFFAPDVPVGMRFEYKQFSNPDEFETDTDDARAIGGDFKGIAEFGTTVTDKLQNRGLQICVDEDEVTDDPNWRERKTGRLLRRLKRNSLIRAVALLEAGATNTAVTWDATAGKDPDQDIENMLAAGMDSSGMSLSRVAVGETARLKRRLSLRAQSHAGGFANAGMTAAELAAYLAVDEVLFAKSRYGTGATKTRLMAALVIAFTAFPGLDPEDPSNIKRFYRLLEGQRYRVYEWRDGPKKYRIAVEHYEKTKLTSTLGIRKLTVS